MENFQMSVLVKALNRGALQQLPLVLSNKGGTQY